MANMLSPAGVLASNGVGARKPPYKEVEVRVASISSPEIDASAMLEKYKEESAKRFRADGMKQFTNLATSEKYQNYIQDIWVDDNAIDPGANSITDGSRHEVLILGAGYGGLLAAARLIQAGIDKNDIRLIDAAGGYGGTWWFNRYPGLMCDVESYCYMPLLEELGYMPKHKYSYGPELRQHAENIARHFDLQDKTLFQARAVSMNYNDSKGEWTTKLRSMRKGQVGQEITVSSRFAILAGGTLNWPKILNLPGMDEFKGHTFHTARWDWAYTGGSDSETNPALVNLTDKRVGIIGTGATAIQAVPELAKWAKKLYVFQRTPSAVDVRGQQVTDEKWWAHEIGGRKGWQTERRLNFAAFASNTIPRPKVNLVDDGWTKFPSYAGLIGSPGAPLSNDDVSTYVTLLSTMDLARQERVRARVDEVVKDKVTADKLKAWYPGWCKRPCFHDDYLESFNSSNVTLVDTDGRGVDGLSEHGVLFDGQEYPVDVLIFSTGYEARLGSSPAGRLHMDVVNHEGFSLDDKWEQGIATLHGIQSNGFPNLFWLGLWQTGLSPNQCQMVDELAQHMAFVFKATVQKFGGRREDHNNSLLKSKDRYAFTIEPTIAAEETWTKKIIASAGAFAAMANCPPSYFNGEGDVYRIADMGPEAREKLARGGSWGRGFADFARELESWRASNFWDDLNIKSIPAL
ncbi:hypothetical protein Z517_03566 [Fonsecaea pedrosoi CBS 271.37]|uniref:FAD/NAD(P)-binding domain-containing protein n=1 Tax=Fonsecaea pedrosoi CBS 271.37 TaxID=1442368 RepID=A0A0D2E2L3_9EURO|nr:uncharacterized protein Z517_03566 [Fonsecaea pedrosoi CBS 271.37]KIW84316.1 hypothetical protein Z517_03566 [Fonsecaea pedrosoi CBS 271.37]